MTLREIGERFEVTKQRVWQIVDRMKEGEGDYYYKHRNKVAS